MKVVINYQEYSDVEIEKGILKDLPGIEIVESRTRDPVEFISQIRDADGIIIQYVPCPQEVIAAMDRAQVIVRYGIAVESIDLAAAKAKGIRVCNVPSYCLDEVSNHALALILALHRRLLPADQLLRAEKHTLEAIRPIPRLKDCTAGLLGFGHIARRLAEKLQPLFRRVIAYDPFVKPEAMARLGVQSVSLEELFRTSDFISIHVPLTPETRHLVSRELLRAMKPFAFLINTSRGAVVDEAALIQALQEKRIAGAGLDVFETEPLPKDNPLCSLDNVVLTHHIAWYSEGAIQELKETAAMEVLRVLRGEEPLYEVKG